MYARPLHRDRDFIKWYVIVSLAAVLTLAIASTLAAAEISKSSNKPQILPPNIGIWSKPTTADIAQKDLGIELWRILGLHREKRFEEAIRAWNEMTMPAEMEVWKYIALGQAALAMLDCDTAERSLARAEEVQPSNAIVHYFRGILRLEQARRAIEWPDNFPRRTRFVSHPPMQIVPNTKSMYILAATMELENAIERADSIHLDEPLMPSSLSTYAPLEPTIGDFLVALGAENFEGKSHNTLGSLFLEHGSLEIAEEHMDAAVRKGMANVFGFKDLADAYRDRGQHVDAARAHLKAMAYGHDKAGAALGVIRNLRDAFINP